MSRYLLFFCLFYSTHPILAQKKDFVIGLQSGNNYSRTVITKEFTASPLKGDYFIGSSFGVVARSKLTTYKWEWGGFSNRFIVFAEYGLGATFGGYNYSYKDEITFQAQYNVQLPLLFVMRPTKQKYWYKNFKGKRIYPIVKAGLTLYKTFNQQLEKKYLFGEDEVLEQLEAAKSINISFTNALGFQREYKNGRIMYIGISTQSFLFQQVEGTVEVRSKQLNEIAQIRKGIILWSLDLQYFFGKRVRNPKHGKLPKIIYNPRF